MALAMTYNLNGESETISGEYNISDNETKEVEKIVSKIENLVLRKNNISTNVVLASLSQIGKKHLNKLNGNANNNDKDNEK